MADLLETTQSLIASLPPTGHGNVRAVMVKLHEQAEATGSFDGLANNWRFYMPFVAMIAFNWVISWWVKNIPAPAADAPVLKRFGYAILLKLSDLSAALPLPGSKWCAQQEKKP